MDVGEGKEKRKEKNLLSTVLRIIVDAIACCCIACAWVKVKKKEREKNLLSAVLWITVDAIVCAYKSTRMLG